MKAWIVEDEAIARSMLVKLLGSSFPDIRICGTADSVAAALKYFDNNPEPDVIFMDVDLCIARGRAESFLKWLG